MITPLKFGKLLLFLTVVTAFFACNKNDNTTSFSVIGEVATVKRKVNEQIVYARMYYAYGNQPMASAKVTLPEGGTLILSAADASQRVYYKEPTLQDFSLNAPQPGQYLFSVVNEDIEHTVTEELVAKALGFTVIKSVASNSSTQSVTIDWESLTGADGYKVMLRNSSSEIVYVGPLLEPIAKKFIVSAGSGLSKQLEDGADYTVELLAYTYEDSSTDENYLYNIEVISISSFDFTMGQ